jgi:hypothetical protein
MAASLAGGGHFFCAAPAGQHRKIGEGRGGVLGQRAGYEGEPIYKRVECLLDATTSA